MTKSNKDVARIPNHIGLILDGNRRWAKSRGLPTLEGHRKGYDNLNTIAKAAFKKDVKYVSAWVFSTENWSRSAEEVKYLMELTYIVVTRDAKELNKENIRVLWLGSPERVSDRLLKAIKRAEESTKNNTGGTLCICFNYGGQVELVDAVKKLIEKGTAPSEVTKESIAGALYSPEIPPVDFLVRTSGEQRTSGFMLYRSDYAELYYVDKHWPDFNEEDLDEALEEYALRERRHGR